MAAQRRNALRQMELNRAAYEADATRHRIAPNSPLARALLGAQVGDVVTWKRPAGNLDLEIVRIAHADP